MPVCAIVGAMSQGARVGEHQSPLIALYSAQWAARRRRLVRATLAAQPGEDVVDVGCGPGFYCAELAHEVGPTGSVRGVDRSPENLAAARRRCAGLPNVELREGDATALPMPSSSVDGAISVQVLEYVPDIAAAVAELRRVLRPGGRLLVWDTDWATLSWYSNEPQRMARVLQAWDEHVAHPSVPSLLGPALRTAGFTDVEPHPYGVLVSGSEPAPDEDWALSFTPLLTNFVGGRGGLSRGEVEAWAAEQRQLRESGEYYVACVQVFFTATVPLG